MHQKGSSIKLRLYVFKPVCRMKMSLKKNCHFEKNRNEVFDISESKYPRGFPGKTSSFLDENYGYNMSTCL